MNFKTPLSALFVIALVGGLLAAAPGGAAAADVQLSNSTVDVTEDTDTAYASINNTASTDTNVSIEYIGIESDGTEKLLYTNDITATANSETLDEQSIDTTTYDQVRISATYNDTNADATNLSADYGTFQQVSGGGGGGVGGLGSNTTIIAIVLLAGGMLVMMREDG